MRLSTIFTLITCLLSAFSYAEDSAFYSGLGYGTARYTIETAADITLTPGQKLRDTTGFADIYAGLQLNPYLGLEVGYTGFEEVEHEYRVNPAVMTLLPVHNRERIDIHRAAISTVVEYPVYEKLSVVGFLGYTHFDVDRKISGGLGPNPGGLLKSGSESEEDFFYGIGLKYSLSAKYSARLQWSETELDTLDMDAIRITLERRF